MNLYEISENLKAFKQMAEESEIDEQAISDTLEALEGSFEDKAESYAIVMQALDNDILAINNEIERLKKLMQTISNNRQRMQNTLFNSMRAVGKEKFKTKLFRFSIRKNGGLAPLILKIKPDDLPQDMQIVTVKPNNQAIREYIELTGDTRYAELGEKGESLVIR